MRWLPCPLTLHKILSSLVSWAAIDLDFFLSRTARVMMHKQWFIDREKKQHWTSVASLAFALVHSFADISNQRQWLIVTNETGVEFQQTTKFLQREGFGFRRIASRKLGWASLIGSNSKCFPAGVTGRFHSLAQMRRAFHELLTPEERLYDVRIPRNTKEAAPSQIQATVLETHTLLTHRLIEAKRHLCGMYVRMLRQLFELHPELLCPEDRQWWSTIAQHLMKQEMRVTAADISTITNPLGSVEAALMNVLSAHPLLLQGLASSLNNKEPPDRSTLHFLSLLTVLKHAYAPDMGKCSRDVQQKVNLALTRFEGKTLSVSTADMLSQKPWSMQSIAAAYIMPADRLKTSQAKVLADHILVEGSQTRDQPNSTPVIAQQVIQQQNAISPTRAKPQVVASEDNEAMPTEQVNAKAQLTEVMSEDWESDDEMSSNELTSLVQKSNLQPSGLRAEGSSSGDAMSNNEPSSIVQKPKPKAMAFKAPQNRGALQDMNALLNAGKLQRVGKSKKGRKLKKSQKRNMAKRARQLAKQKRNKELEEKLEAVRRENAEFKRQELLKKLEASRKEEEAAQKRLKKMQAQGNSAMKSTLASNVLSSMASGANSAFNSNASSNMNSAVNSNVGSAFGGWR
eukprot:Gregarina_sp_Poly_1__7@NODE_1001_length_5410_cov_144_854950_g702_i0_p1_GENE_NODE_1001_length_5410_cov_144_854950_g702_i0NODE_1001_length_5410_cov_144_854950_g702_i0_p1_ORF_typecomplete_len627_score84_03DUF2226/PF09987_9/0_041Vma12/PF11712_8/3_6e03Vma12/PF11712_8/0_62RNA_pol_Rpb6/PF01192_22/4_1Atg14/PF10186_9/5_7_NODE_1001_length_5410_cov_144_854950_g702_i012083088